MKANLYKKENNLQILSLKTDKININLHIKDMDIDNKELVEEFLKLNLKPKLIEKKENGEVFTPSELINEMLDKLPEEVWSNKDLKWFDPSVGMGNFMVEVYWRLLEGLVDEIPDFNQRKQHIIKNMIYMSELNEENIKHCNRIFSDGINIYQGDTLKLDTLQEWGIEKFDVIVGNPPYNIINHNNGHSSWGKFVNYNVDKMEKNGFLAFVHPNGWRKPVVDYSKSKYDGLYDLLTRKNTMLYLEIHDAKDGLRTFQSGTRYDWYVIKNCDNDNNLTMVKDENGNINMINFNDLKFLPNSNIDDLLKILSYNDSENLKVLAGTNLIHANNKKQVSKIKSEHFLYPLIHSTTKSGVIYRYTCRNDKGYFGIPKIIFGDSGINNIVVDIKGEYGMTQHAIGIEIDDEEYGAKLKIAIESEKFKKLLSKCKWSNYMIDWRLFTYIKKDFWKDFV